MNPDGITIPAVPDPAKHDPKELMEQIGRLNQQIVRERQDATKRLNDGMAKCKVEMDKLRQTTYQHGKDLDNQNSALLQSLGRLKEENDDLKKQILTLQLQRGNGEVRAQPTESPVTVPVVPQSPSLGGEEIPHLPPRA